MASLTDRQTLAPLVSAVRMGALSAAGLVDESLSRIDAMGDLGAVIRIRADEARADARVMDGLVRGGHDPGPLAGLPVLVKDNEAVGGLPTTHGSRLRMDVEPEAHHGLVASLLCGAGAIVVGKTNLPEYAFEGYTDNLLFGATTNPWDRSASPGGSSGGSGAALAAGLAPIATATDVGGSIRIPAALCGLVGLKPTSGLVAVDPSLIAPELNSHGPLTTTVADAELLLELLITGSPGERAMSHAPALDDRPVRLVVTERLVAGPALAGGLATAFHAAVRALQAAVGASFEDSSPSRLFPEGYDSADWFRIVGYEQAHALGREVIERESARLDATFAGYMQLALEISLEDHLAARRRRHRYAAELDRLLGQDAVLVSPTLTVEGWSPDGRLPGRDDVGLPSWVFNTEPPNLTGHPALSLPGGLLPDGRPFGLQLVGPRSSDRRLLGLAAAYERATAWPLTAPGRPSFTVEEVGSGPAIAGSAGQGPITG